MLTSTLRKSVRAETKRQYKRNNISVSAVSVLSAVMKTSSLLLLHQKIINRWIWDKRPDFPLSFPCVYSQICDATPGFCRGLLMLLDEPRGCFGSLSSGVMKDLMRLFFELADRCLISSDFWVRYASAVTCYIIPSVSLSQWKPWHHLRCVWQHHSGRLQVHLCLVNL